MTQLRIALTLPGAASLGAFEAGAVAALVTAVERVEKLQPGTARIDAIAGASSGALTAVLAARMLLEGGDAVPPLRRAWVPEPSLRALWGRGGRAPLSLERAREVADDVLALADFQPWGAPQSSPLTLDIVLGCLRGFEYDVPRSGRAPLPATSYVDWGAHVLRPGSVETGGTPAEEWTAAADTAIASASHPVAFPAAILNRDAVRHEYETHGIRNLPDREHPLELRYVDGGLVDNQPLGRCFKQVQKLDAEDDTDATRLVLLIQPDPDLLPDRMEPDWTGLAPFPRWSQTLGQATRVVATHSVYEDLRRTEKTNSRIHWTSELATALAELLADETEARARLEEALARIDRDKSEYGRHRPAAVTGDEAESLADLVERALRMATGLENKLPVDVEIVTPAGPTAGRNLLQFGGFLAERLRAYNFGLGYRSMLSWMESPATGLTAYGLDPELAGEVCADVRRHGEWLGDAEAGEENTRLGFGTQLRLLRLALRSLRIGVADLWARGGRGREGATTSGALRAGQVFANPKSGASLEVIRAPGRGGTLEVRRVLKSRAGRSSRHVHLDFVERFVVEGGVAEAELAGQALRLRAGEELVIPADTPHVNPHKGETAGLILRHSFEPATRGARGFVATLGELMRQGRDDEGDLPIVVALALFDATRSRTYLASIPQWIQRRLLFPLGRLLARVRGYRLRLPN